jgi:hypothetical protein
MQVMFVSSLEMVVSANALATRMPLTVTAVYSNLFL